MQRLQKKSRVYKLHFISPLTFPSRCQERTILTPKSITMEKTMKIEQMKTAEGRPVANQFIITDNEGNRVFQSYESVIARIDKNGDVFLDQVYWAFSGTTGKYRNIFLGEERRTTEGKINSGEYKLVNLN